MEKIEDLHPFVASIYEAYEQDNESRRKHLGASSIGDKCSRKIWYSFRNIKTIKHPGRLKRLFQTGHLYEARFVSDLIKIGIKLIKQNFKILSDIGHFGGEADGMLEDGRIVEFKTHNQKSFEKLVKVGVKEAKPNHYVQMQTYSHYTSKKGAMYVAVNKNTDELYIEDVEYDEAFISSIITKAKDIITSQVPPAGISERADWYECKMCDYHDVCFENRFPERNCRTCAHSTPERDGSWSCGLHRSEIKDEDGCEMHCFIPPLIDAEIVDAGLTWVKYNKDGTEWTDGVRTEMVPT